MQFAMSLVNQPILKTEIPVCYIANYIMHIAAVVLLSCKFQD